MKIKETTDRETCKSLSANTLNISGNLINVKQSNTLIRIVSKQQHVLQHVNFGSQFRRPRLQKFHKTSVAICSNNIMSKNYIKMWRIQHHNCSIQF